MMMTKRMKNLLFIDAVIFVIATLAAFLTGDLAFIINIIGFTGLIFIITAGILTGSFVSRNRVRANYNSDNKERREKNRLSKNFFFVGLINISISIFTYEITKQGFSLMHRKSQPLQKKGISILKPVKWLIYSL